MLPIARMVFGLLALTIGLVLIVASGPRVLADPPPADPLCNDMYEDTATTPCLSTAILCEHQDDETKCNFVSNNNDAKHVEYFPKQCVFKDKHYCGEELRQCWTKATCKWESGKCLEDKMVGPWTSVKGPTEQTCK